MLQDIRAVNQVKLVSTKIRCLDIFFQRNVQIFSFIQCRLISINTRDRERHLKFNLPLATTAGIQDIDMAIREVVIDNPFNATNFLVL